MSRQNVEAFLIAGGASNEIKSKYDVIEDKEIFVKTANEDGYIFSVDDFISVLNASGDSFESYGNPRKKSIWWK